MQNTSVEVERTIRTRTWRKDSRSVVCFFVGIIQFHACGFRTPRVQTARKLSAIWEWRLGRDLYYRRIAQYNLAGLKNKAQQAPVGFIFCLNNWITTPLSGSTGFQFQLVLEEVYM